MWWMKHFHDIWRQNEQNGKQESWEIRNPIGLIHLSVCFLQKLTTLENYSLLDLPKVQN